MRPADGEGLVLLDPLAAVRRAVLLRLRHAVAVTEQAPVLPEGSVTRAGDFRYALRRQNCASALSSFASRCCEAS